MDTSSAHDVSHTDLRQYQRTAVDLIIEGLTQTGRAHISLPTGSGKSRVLVDIARHYLDRTTNPGPGTVIVVSPRTTITGQLADAMVGAGHRVTTLPTPARLDGSAGPVVVGTVPSLRRWVRRNAVTPTLILVDEAHHATAAGCRALFDKHPEADRVGVTATPYRHDGQRLDEVLGRCVFVRDPDSPDLAGVLAPVSWYPVILPVDLGKVQVDRNSWHDTDYASSALGAVLTTPEAIAATVAGTSELIRGRSTVVFAATVVHGRALTAAYLAAGHRVGEIYGTTPTEERDRLIAGLTAPADDPARVDVLVSVGALTEGFDCPPVDALVIARPTRSDLLYIQMIGRGLRACPGKSDCLVLDVTGADGSTVPTATGQIFAPTVLPSLTAPTAATDDDVDQDNECKSEWWSPSRRQIRQIGTGRRSPAWSWSPGPDGAFTVPLADGQVGVLIPEGETGLWSPRIVDRRSGAVTTLAEPLPARHAVDQFAGKADKHLTREDSKWRSHPATDLQLSILAQLDPTIADRAISEGWAKGHTGDVIGALIAHRKINTHREPSGTRLPPELIAAASTPLYRHYHTSADLGTPSQVRKEASGVEW